MSILSAFGVRTGYIQVKQRDDRKKETALTTTTSTEKPKQVFYQPVIKSPQYPQQLNNTEKATKSVKLKTEDKVSQHSGKNVASSFSSFTTSKPTHSTSIPTTTKPMPILPSSTTTQRVIITTYATTTQATTAQTTNPPTIPPRYPPSSFGNSPTYAPPKTTEKMPIFLTKPPIHDFSVKATINTTKPTVKSTTMPPTTTRQATMLGYIPSPTTKSPEVKKIKMQENTMSQNATSMTSTLLGFVTPPPSKHPSVFNVTTSKSFQGLSTKKIHDLPKVLRHPPEITSAKSNLNAATARMQNSPPAVSSILSSMMCPPKNLSVNSSVEIKSSVAKKTPIIEENFSDVNEIFYKIPFLYECNQVKNYCNA